MSQPPRPIRSVDLAEGVWVAAADLRYSFARSGGPGGQAVNKLSTQAKLRVAVESIVGLSEGGRQRLRTLAGRRLTKADEIVLAATGTRSQLDNKRACLARLRDLVTKASKVPKKRKPTKPSRAAVRKRLEQKRRVARKKASRRKPDEDRHEGT